MVILLGVLFFITGMKQVEKTPRIVNYITRILFGLFGIILIISDNALIDAIIVGLVFIFLGIINMTFPDKKSFITDFFDKHFSKRTKRVLELIISLLIISFGIVILIWQLF